MNSELNWTTGFILTAISHSSGGRIQTDDGF